MLDLQFICDNQEAVAQNCEARGLSLDIPALVQLREERNRLNTAGDELRRQQNEASSKIPKASPDERPARVNRASRSRSSE